MAFGEEFGRRAVAEKNEREHVKPVDITPTAETLEELIHDESESKQFWHFLGAKKATGGMLQKAWTRYLEGKPTEGDETIIAAQFEEYQKNKGVAAESYTTLTRSLDDVLRNSEAFRKFRNRKGAENVIAVIERGFRDRAIAESAAFAPIRAEIEKLKALQEREKASDERITKWAAEHGITDDARVREIITNEDEEDRRVGIQRMLREGMTLRERLVDKLLKRPFGYGTVRVAREISDEDPVELDKERARTTKEFGDWLSNLLTSDETFRHALARMHMDKKPAFEEGSEAVPTLVQLRESAKPFTKEALVTAARAAKTATPAKLWKSKAVRDAKRDKVYDEYHARLADFEKKTKKRPGLIGRIFLKLHSFFKPPAGGDPEVDKVFA